MSKNYNNLQIRGLSIYRFKNIQIFPVSLEKICFKSMLRQDWQFTKAGLISHSFVVDIKNPYREWSADAGQATKKYSVKLLTSFPKILSRCCGTALSCLQLSSTLSLGLLWPPSMTTQEAGEWMFNKTYFF